MLLSPSAAEDFDCFTTDTEPYDSVVIGLAPTKFNYENLNKAFRILSSRPEDPDSTARVPLLATHRARYVRSSSGELSLGPGPFVSAIEVAVGDGLRAESVGKPERAFFEVCLKDINESLDMKGEGKENLLVEEVAIVGDDIEADLAGGAIELGLKRILGKPYKYHLRKIAYFLSHSENWKISFWG